MSSFQVWIGRCRSLNNQVEASYLVAVWADSRDTFSTRLENYLASIDSVLIWFEEPLPASKYSASNPTVMDIQALKDLVLRGQSVAMRRIGEAVDNCFIVEKIKGVMPLDEQLGVHPKLTVPDTLYGVLFGQTEPLQSEIEYFGNLENIPEMKTYAILDAAKFTSGAIEFEGYDLPFRCLFKGTIAEELYDVAPYLFELSVENPFTRRLMTHHVNQPNEMTSTHLWHKEPGIYIRSRLSFDDMWKHFRKFTRVQDENGKWYYFRFWEARFMRELPNILTPENAKKLIPHGMTIIWTCANPSECGKVIRATVGESEIL